MLCEEESSNLNTVEQKLRTYKSYEDLTLEQYNNEYDSLINKWELFVKINDPCLLQGKDYFIHKRNIFEVIRRVDKRRVYYKVFHDLTKINEFKYISLLCYWINTLKPFMVINENSKIYNSPNELFSVFLIISTTRGIFERVYPEKSFLPPTEKRITDMVYNFKYCDLSREATIAFVETFADTYGVGIQYILSPNPNL